MTPWFIDAFDVRGGLAIATQRQPDLKLDNLEDVGASAFISPPAFVPEYVGSRSIGLALGRNRGQLGLFLHDDEVSFDGLAAVAEFVRRSYLRGAGGDGAGENGGSSPPPSPDDEPGGTPEGLPGIEGGGESAGRTDPAGALLWVARINCAHSKGLEVGTSHPGEPLPKPGGTASEAVVRRRRLARGALRVLRELIRRRPKKQPDMLHWAMILEKLVILLSRMALWPVMLEEFPNRDATTWVFDRNYGSMEVATEQCLYDLLRSYPERGSPYWPRVYWAGWTMTDMFDDLAAFPAPARAVPFAPKEGQNLQALLSAAAATPSETLHSDSDDLNQERAELAIFAAACLTLSGESSPEDHRIFIEFTDRVARKAQTWLGDNLPRFVYAREVESLIQQASGVPA